MRELSLTRAEHMELSAEILAKGGALRVEAHGSSMHPLIRDGDVLTIQPAEAPTLKVGDVALYRVAGERMVAHRIVGRPMRDGGAMLAARGDSSNGTDEEIHAEQVMGRVVLIQRGETTISLDRGFPWWAVLLWLNATPLGRRFLRLARILRRAALLLLGWRRQ